MSEEIDLEEAAPWLVLLLTLAGGALRVLLLATKGMGLDETVSVWLAGHSLSEMLPWLIKINQQPPLYYFLLHFWVGLNGGAPYYARLLSVLFGAAAIPILYLTGKRLAGATVGLAAAVILAVSPFHIFFAQEASPYSLLTFNAAVAFYALARLLTDPRTVRPFGHQLREYVRAWRNPAPLDENSERDFYKKRGEADLKGWRGWRARHHWLPIQSISTDLSWITYILFTAATLLSHRAGLLFFIAGNLFVFGLMLLQRIPKSGATPSMQAPAVWNWIAAQVVIVVLWLPWLLFASGQGGAVFQLGEGSPLSWQAFTQMLRSFLNASNVIPANIATGIWIFYALVLGLGLVFLRKKLTLFFFLAALFVLPLLSEGLMSLWQPSFAAETLIWTTIPLFVLLGAGVAQVRFRGLILFLLGALATLNVFAVSDYFRFYQKEDWNSAARTVVGHAEKTDLVLFNTNLGVIPFDYYFEPYAEQYSLQGVEKRGLPQDLFESGIAAPIMTAADVPSLKSLLEGHDRVWLVYSREAASDPQGLIAQTLAENLLLTDTEPFYGGVVQLYVTP